MNQDFIQKIGQKEMGEKPLEIIRKTIGICNEVYELKFTSKSVILRMNQQKEWIYGTHRFLPLFQKLQIKTPEILAEDYSKTEFPFCYQILSKIEGEDLLLAMDELTPDNLTEIAQEVSDIFDKFNSLPYSEDFGMMTGLNEKKEESLIISLEEHQKVVLERNQTSKVLDGEILDIHQELLETYRNYFLGVKPKVYYDDICAKNLMIHEGKFNGLVDLDFLIKGDYLEAIGRMISVWHGHESGEFYIKEIVRLQKLDEFQQNIIKVYAILNLILWTSEAGVRFNGNTTGEINWENVERNKRRIKAVYNSMN